MKISMYKFYKTSIITCLVLGVIWIIVPFVPYLFYYDGSIEDLIFLLCITLPIGFGIALFPIMLYHRQLTHVSLERDKCTSYSLLNRKLCEVAYNESVFYTFFDVKFLYAPPIRFIALSNMPFKCEQNAKSIAERGFYGNYDRSKIVILPYDEQVSPFLNLSATATRF